MDRVGHNDRLRDLRHNSSVAVTEFILISEHLSNRSVSDVKQSPCWISVVDETTHIAAICCLFHLPQPGQSEDLTLCRSKTKQRNRLFDVTLNALINVSMNGPERLQYGAYVCAAGLDILKVDKNSTDL